MDAVLEQYGIDESLSANAQITLLEKERQKTLRKLNHVLGNTQKEKELGDELDRIEAVMSRLEWAGGTQISMEDVKLEVKAMSQTQLTFTADEEPTEQEKDQVRQIELVRKIQRQIMTDQGKTVSLCMQGIRLIADFYESRNAYDSLETWLTYGAQWVPDSYFVVRLYRFLRSREDVDPHKRFYWTKRAADVGDTDACYELANRYFARGTAAFNAKEASYYFAKAAGREHPDAYLYAAAAFAEGKDYQRAELCLETAYERGISGAAARLAAMYDTKENSTGSRDAEKVRCWCEKASKESSNS